MCTQTSERDARRVFKIKIKVQQGRVIRLLNLLIFSLCYNWSIVGNIQTRLIITRLFGKFTQLPEE